MIFLWEEKIEPTFLEIYFNEVPKKEEFIFFDIETTGLGFTKSNFIFLIGIGTILGDRFIIKQFVIREKESEREVYDTLFKEIEKAKAIFTYNGERFDIPLFLKRLKMYEREEDIRRMKELWHIDLLKFARELWKKEIGSCTLGNVEKRVLNIIREEDLPGFLVPTYFELYLKENDIRYLNRILKHNRQDILSLYYILENIIRKDVANGKRRIEIPSH